MYDDDLGDLTHQWPQQHAPMHLPFSLVCTYAPAFQLSCPTAIADCLLAQANPTFRPLLDQYFPRGEVFFPISKNLYHPAPLLLHNITEFANRNFRDCTIALQYREAKVAPMLPRVTMSPQVYCDLASSLVHSRGLRLSDCTFFVASDVEHFYTTAQRYFGAGNVCWTDNGISSGHTGMCLDCPGTPATGLVDVFLMSLADEVVGTWASTFGTLAAGLGSIKAHTVYFNLTGGERVGMLKQQWYFRQVVPEPCFWKAGKLFESTTDFGQFSSSPFWLQQLQCHPYR